MAASEAWPMIINGEEILSTKKVAVIDPVTGGVAGHVSESTVEDVARATAAAKKAQVAWAMKSPVERSTILMNLASLMEANKERLVNLEISCTGKPAKLARDGDIPFAIDNLKFFAGAVRHMEGIAATEFMGGYTSFMRREPIGVVGAICPWNYPFMMAVWKAGPALATGNAVVIKPAPNTPFTTIEFVRLAIKAGVPPGVFNVVLGGAEVGQALCSSPDVSMVTFTGSTATGTRIAAIASPLIKRVTLELGGKAPFVVFGDANIATAVQSALVGAIQNTGQDCTAATRLIIHESVYDKFVEAFLAECRKVVVGPPFEASTTIGPLVSAEHRNKVHSMVQEAKASGATILLGGELPSTPGFFYPVTVIANVTQASKCVQEEIFGPVVTLQKFVTDEEAVTMANGVKYGLAGSVWTTDVRRAMRMTAAIQAGTVWINDHMPLVSECPHGGFKQSGIGKDMSHYALEECTIVKHVMFETDGAVVKPWHCLVYTP